MRMEVQHREELRRNMEMSSSYEVPEDKRSNIKYSGCETEAVKSALLGIQQISNHKDTQRQNPPQDSRQWPDEIASDIGMNPTSSQNVSTIHANPQVLARPSYRSLLVG